MKRVVYLSCIPLTAKVSRDWYLDYLRESAVQVEFWDITCLLRGTITEHHSREADYVRKIEDLPILEQAIIHQRDAVFVLLLPKTWQFRTVFRLLSHHRCKTVIVKWGAMPAFGAASGAGVSRWMGSPRVFLSKIRNRFQSSILGCSWYVQPYDLVFAAGQVMLSKPEVARRMVSIGLCDYDQYALTRKGARHVNGKYAIFLDIYLPFQSDLALVGMQPVQSAVYYAELNRFFSAIERRHGVEVVIAAHPKAHYVKDEFQGRKVIAEKTPELVRDAELVICHSSTSISYAVLNRKPVWAIYTDEMAHLYRHNFMLQILALAAYLKLPVFNVSQVDDAGLPALGQLSEDHYVSYEKDFVVTPGIDGGQSKEIFLREIMSLGD